jgi:2-iminoacetate synthase
MNKYDYEKYTERDVKVAINNTERTVEDFKALLSPAALPFIEEIAQAAQVETRKHFGNSTYMFTPIYIANNQMRCQRRLYNVWYDEPIILKN